MIGNKLFISFLITIIILIQQCSCRQFHLRKESFELTHQLNQRNIENIVAEVILGCLISPIIFIISFYLIWKNQKKAAIDHRRIELANKIIKQINPQNLSQIIQANGQLVHISGKTQTHQNISDPISGIIFSNVIKIKRDVEVRQYRIFGSGDDQTLDLQWVSCNQQVIVGYTHHNDPTNWFIKPQTFKNNNIKLYEYILSESLIDQLQYQQFHKPKIQQAHKISQNSSRKNRIQPYIYDNYIYFPILAGQTDAHGTLRIKYHICRPGDITVISQSQQNTFVPFRIDIKQNGIPDQDQDQDQEERSCCCSGKLFQPIRQINFIQQKQVSSEQMLKQHMNKISSIRNMMRFCCYILLVLSICTFFSPLHIILGYIPIIGGFLKSIINISIFITTLILALPLFILSVSISWLRFHPKIGFIIFGIGLLIVGIVALIIILINQSKKQ